MGFIYLLPEGLAKFNPNGVAKEKYNDFRNCQLSVEAMESSGVPFECMPSKNQTRSFRVYDQYLTMSRRNTHLHSRLPGLAMPSHYDNHNYWIIR
ncbi:MAG: hypothetical protein U5K54_26670 [Cytophagales bacterium]|nr:hypothetical protein [Cytophagales bacterium]